MHPISTLENVSHSQMSIDVLEFGFHTLRSGTGCSVAAPECRLLGMASPSPWMGILEKGLEWIENVEIPNYKYFGCEIKPVFLASYLNLKHFMTIFELSKPEVHH